MVRYLDPKSDIVFKKIFGEHPHLLKSFLNAVLPLPDDGQIETLEYLAAEQIPKIPILKRTVVDVKCKDQQGQIFIVEMQIEWTDSFMQRLLFGTAQAYVKQLTIGEEYHLLNPVYGLALVNSIFDKETPDWYHHYGLVKLTNHKEHVIKGLTLVFVELPKYKTSSLPEKKLKVLWLRFMKEITEKTREIDPELLKVPEIKEAIALAEESSYTPGELEYYESYWKQVSSEKTLISERTAKALAEGKAEGKAEGARENSLTIARAMKIEGMSIDMISKFTGLKFEEINLL